MQRTTYGIFAMLALMGGSTTAEARTYAVLVGATDYSKVESLRGLKEDYNLPGAAYDVYRMADVLRTHYGVQKSDTFILTDGKPTNATSDFGSVKNLTSRLLETTFKGIAGRMGVGETIVFYYSGHGIQRPDVSEPDGKVEMILLPDNQAIPDDKLYIWRKDLNSKGINTVFIFDSCFSGGMKMNAGPFLSIKSKLIDAPVKPNAVWSQSTMVTMQPNISDEDKRKPNFQPGTDLFLAASKEDQEALEVETQGKEKGGLFTLLLTQTLAKNPKLSIDDAISQVNRGYKAYGMKQVANVASPFARRLDQPLLVR